MNAMWITPKRILGRTALYRFSKTVCADKDTEIELNISADTRYKLYFNGEYICEGPCQSDHWLWRYETVKIPREYIKQGENLISADVLYIPDDIFQTQARKERAALIVFGTATLNGKTDGISTDGSWECDIITDRLFVSGNELDHSVASCVPPFEKRTLDKSERVGVQVYKNTSFENRGVSPYGLSDHRRLTPRTIKLLTPEPPVAFRATKITDTSVCLDAGRYTTAFPVFTFKGERGGVIRFTYAECCFDANGKKLDRDDPNGEIKGTYDEITFTGDVQSFESYFFKAFRYVKAEFPKGTEFAPSGQVYKPYFYPLDGGGKVTFSNERLNRVWDVSVNTLKCCTHETFVDCPYYEQCQYDMDTAIEMMAMMRLTDDYSMPKKAVYDLARSQRPDGMLCAHYPTSWAQVIPTFSLFWILMLRDYVTYSGDIDTAKELLPVADRVLNAFELLKNGNGLVGVTEHWHYTDWVPGWKRGIPPMGDREPLTVSSMMYACALGVAETLAEETGRKGLAAEYRTRKAEMIAAVNGNCYDADKQFYVDVPGYKTYSEHTAVWAVLSECVTGEDAKALLDRSFAYDVARASFSFSYYTFRALEKAGYYKKYSDRLFNGWFRMLDMGCTTWCENPDSPRSECHAWSAAPIYEYSAMILGVKPTENGFKKVRICPDLTFCNNISGFVPTPKGMISVSFETQNGETEFRASVPNGIEAEIAVGGEEYRLSGGELKVLVKV